MFFLKTYSEYSSALTRCQEERCNLTWGWENINNIMKSIQPGCVRWEQLTNTKQPVSHSPAYISPFAACISVDGWVPQTFIKCWNQIQ